MVDMGVYVKCGLKLVGNICQEHEIVNFTIIEDFENYKT
jgi:hypothetical protein